MEIRLKILTDMYNDRDVAHLTIFSVFQVERMINLVWNQFFSVYMFMSNVKRSYVGNCYRFFFNLILNKNMFSLLSVLIKLRKFSFFHINDCFI